MKLFNKILLSCVSFSFLLFSFLFLRFYPDLKIREANAQITPQCSSLMAGDKEDDVIGDVGGVTNRLVHIYAVMDKNPSDVIIQRYIYSGLGTWESVSPTYSSDIFDVIATDKTYSEAKDYTVGAAWMYRNALGEVKTITCSRCLRIFDTRETGINFGTTRLIYPTKTSGTQVISGSKRYIGFVRGGRWSGNNMGVCLSPGDGWKWREEYTNITKVTADTRRECDEWGPTTLVYLSSAYPKLLPIQFTFALTAPSQAANGAYSDYGFNNLLIYSRNVQKNPDGTCGSLPSVPLPTPTPTPTATPTPTLLINKCYSSCSTNADCGGSLACGYNVAWGERRCHNPLCANESSCICSWQKSTPTPTIKLNPTPTPTPTSAVNKCYSSCSTNADCGGSLACGYNVAWGERRCHNPSCPRENDCICNW